MPMPVTESVVEEAALSWFQELGYAVLLGPDMAPGEPATERTDYSRVVLVGRLRGMLLPWLISGEVRVRGAERFVEGCV